MNDNINQYYSHQKFLYYQQYCLNLEKYIGEFEKNSNFVIMYMKVPIYNYLVKQIDDF